MASEFNSLFAWGSPLNEEILRKQQDWLNKAFGIATDVISGPTTISPRYEIDDQDDVFRVALDLPGVERSDIDILVEDDTRGRSNNKVLTIRGIRKVRRTKEEDGGEPRELTFSKSFPLDDTVDTDQITAQLENGVLIVSAVKKAKEPEPPVIAKKIPIL